MLVYKFKKNRIVIYELSFLKFTNSLQSILLFLVWEILLFYRNRIFYFATIFTILYCDNSSRSIGLFP